MFLIVLFLSCIMFLDDFVNKNVGGGGGGEGGLTTFSTRYCLGCRSQ